MGVQEPYNPNLYTWFRELSERLRNVRVVCGDWTRVCGGNWQDKMPPVGIFFDPPYGSEKRNTKLYHEDSMNVAQKVAEWALSRGDNKNYRIVVAGYEEHEQILTADRGWSVVQWSARGGYSNISKSGKVNNNRHEERLYFSPFCFKKTATKFQEELFT
jgi:site-specific DNA-adenine methylase